MRDARLAQSFGNFSLLALRIFGLLLIQPFCSPVILAIIVQELRWVQSNFHAPLFRSRLRLLTAVCLDQTCPSVTAFKYLVKGVRNL
jgi:hypothetical protein